MAKSPSKSRTLRRTVQSLGFDNLIRNSLVRHLKYLKEKRYEGSPGTREHYEWCDAEARRLTVQDVITALGDKPERDYRKRIRPDISCIRAFKARIMELGLTTEDWILLAPSMKDAKLFRINQAEGKSKKAKLATNIECLPMSPIGMKCLEFHFQRPRNEITLKDLLESSSHEWGDEKGLRDRGHGSQSFPNPCKGWGRKLRLTESIANTRALLKKWGFTWKDGLFLDEYSERWHIEKIMKAVSVSKQTAKRILTHMMRSDIPRIEQ